MQLTAAEARVLGSLIEKEITTPEYYPLSLNALLAACNQKSSREPVMNVTEDDARGALRLLEDAELVSVDHGSRVQRYEHRARTVFHLRRDETAILCLLLLRGPQTPGELRGRADRLHSFEDIEAVSAALARMAATAEQRPEPLVAQMPRQPGAREQRYMHTLGDPADLPYAVPPTAGLHAAAERSRQAPGTVAEEDSALAGRVARLEEEVAGLRATVDRLAQSGAL